MIRLEEGFRFVCVYRERFEEPVFLLLFAMFSVGVVLNNRDVLFQ